MKKKGKPIKKLRDFKSVLTVYVYNEGKEYMQDIEIDEYGDLKLLREYPCLSVK